MLSKQIASCAARMYRGENDQFHLTFQLNHHSLHCCSGDLKHDDLMQKARPAEVQKSLEKAEVRTFLLLKSNVPANKCLKRISTRFF